MNSPAAPAPKPPHLLHRMVRAVVFRLVRLFYVPVELRGRGQVPVAGPSLFVLNHPNGLLDPLLLMIALERPVAFLAKSTFFGNPVGRFLMQVFGALPVFRRSDQGKRGGAEDASEAGARNEETFARCRTLLQDGGALALFPEGTTHSDARLRPLRTGAARIALSTEAAGPLDLPIVPVGLWYEDKARFRSAVLLAIGEPFTITSYLSRYSENARAAERDVTTHIDAALDSVVLQAENAELLRAMPAVAAWTLPNGAASDLSRLHAWTATLLEAYQALHHRDPARLEHLAVEARRYAALLEGVGIDDPWTLETAGPRRGRLLGWLLRLAVLAPFALAGFLMSYGPYRLAGPLAKRMVRGEQAILGTVKLIAGAVFVLIGWMVEAVIAGVLFGPGWGGVLLVLAPALGYAALRWGEQGRRLQEWVSYRRLRLRRGRLVALLAERRRELTREIEEAVAATG